MKDWEYHPLAEELTPPMPPDQFAKLKESIRLRGVRKPAMQFEGKLLDGRHRHRALKELRDAGLTKAENGADLDLVVRDEPDGWTRKDAALFVADENLHRRQMTKEQLVAKAVALVKILEGPAKERMLAGKRAGGADPNAMLQEAGETLSSVEDRVSGRSVTKAAKATGLSKATVERAVAVDKKGTPEVKAAVASGAVSVRKGAEIAKLPPAEQDAAVAKAKGEAPPEPTPVDPIRAVIDEARSQVASLLLKLTAIDKQLDACERLPGFDAIPTAATLKQNTGAIREALTEQRPYGVCPSCRGEKCNACKNRGWVTIGAWAGFSQEKRAKVYSAT